ncbi:PREDICTED: uncharacterized protein LOC106897418 [Calidris pugnax]|uniref:uncharacterized protein LOC106897418 n=1 Tax=Calidris pugnax TaxID=198806 RepID=UPI00071CEDB4|nr:PREDICTED: uncharacterized protein LOC106897418 [Calidris pugnax]
MSTWMSIWVFVQVSVHLDVHLGVHLGVVTAAHMLLSAGSSTPIWRYEEGIKGVFLSSDVQVTAGQLRVTTGGLYLLYGQFGVTCTTSTCPRGTITLELCRGTSPLLVIPLTLADDGKTQPVRSSLVQAVGQLQTGDVLSLGLKRNMERDIEDGWQLAQDNREGNFVGLLRIAGGDVWGDRGWPVGFEAGSPSWVEVGDIKGHH